MPPGDFTIFLHMQPGSLYIGILDRSDSLTIWTLNNMDQVITEVLHVMIIFLNLFRVMMDLDYIIMRFR